MLCDNNMISVLLKQMNIWITIKWTFELLIYYRELQMNIRILIITQSRNLFLSLSLKWNILLCVGSQCTDPRNALLSTATANGNYPILTLLESFMVSLLLEFWIHLNTMQIILAYFWRKVRSFKLALLSYVYYSCSDLRHHQSQAYRPIPCTK